MFKCSNSYCIYLSAVCDGQCERKEGGDELIRPLAPLTSFPGSIKCQGGNRCVRRDQFAVFRYRRGGGQEVKFRKKIIQNFF